MPSMEAWPCQDKRFWLHEWLLAGWGMPIGELFDLERLSEVCRGEGRWSFFFSSVPLKVRIFFLRTSVYMKMLTVKVPGGVASPPNGVAIL